MAIVILFVKADRINITIWNNLDKVNIVAINTTTIILSSLKQAKWTLYAT